MYDAEYEWPEDRVPRSSAVGRVAFQVQTTAMKNTRNQGITAGMAVGVVLLLAFLLFGDNKPPPPPPPHATHNGGTSPAPEPAHHLPAPVPEPDLPSQGGNTCRDGGDQPTCGVHGSCHQDGSNWNCACDDGWKGTHCETQPTAPEPPPLPLRRRHLYLRNARPTTRATMMAPAAAVAGASRQTVVVGSASARIHTTESTANMR